MKLDSVEIHPTYHGTYHELIPIEIMISQDKLHQVYLKLSKDVGEIQPTSLSTAEELPALGIDLEEKEEIWDVV